MENIIITDIKIEVIQKDIKNVHLSVHPPNGRVRLAVPEYMDEEAIRLFAISKLMWIKKQRKQFDIQERQSEREYVSGESHYFVGKRYIMNVVETKEKQHIDINGKYLDIYVKGNSTPLGRKRLLNNYYRSYLKSEIPQCVEKWEKIMDIEILEWGIKLMKTKWGTCNIESKRIWVNLNLAKKSPRCLEYIIVHEMMHLIERNHNDRFLEYMNQYLPNWKSVKDELNEIVFDVDGVEKELLNK